MTTLTIKDLTKTWWVGNTGIWQSHGVTSWVKVLKVSNVAQQYKLGKQDPASVNKASAVGSPSVVRLQVLSQARVPEAQHSKPHENQPGDHSAEVKTITEPESPLTPPQDTVSVQTGTLASDRVTSTKPNASDGGHNNSVGQTALTTGSDSYTNSSATICCAAKGGRELSSSKKGKVGAYKPTCTNRSQTWENPRPASGADAHLFNGWSLPALRPHALGHRNMASNVPSNLTSSPVLANFQAVLPRPKTWNKLIGPSQISWETHTGVTKFSLSLHIPSPAVSPTSAMHWTHLWYFSDGAG